jgi:3-phosphoglycerate kinase
MTKKILSNISKAKIAFLKDCKKDNLIPLEENINEYDESDIDVLDNLRFVQNNRNKTTEKKPVFH